MYAAAYPSAWSSAKYPTRNEFLRPQMTKVWKRFIQVHFLMSVHDDEFHELLLPNYPPRGIHNERSILIELNLKIILRPILSFDFRFG